MFRYVIDVSGRKGCSGSSRLRNPLCKRNTCDFIRVYVSIVVFRPGRKEPVVSYVSERVMSEFTLRIFRDRLETVRLDVSFWLTYTGCSTVLPVTKIGR